MFKAKIDSLVKGYRLLKQISVPEFKMTAFEFQHEKTKAKHIHLERADKNKTFGVQFRTPAPNSSGVPHILEHTVLCGSDKYPVRDPFFKMLTRSQATFMNAMTASDWTLYPFSSMNNKDFNNLLSIYLDAVFRPKLQENNFMQEGWRLEPCDIANVDGEFELKGVVYNEMKGVFSNSMNNFAHKCENTLLPQTYPYISGGDPSAIPDLTYEQLRQFHRQLYHPSNSKFFTYGDVDIERILSQIDTDYLSHYNYDSSDTAISLEPKWTAPRSLDIFCQPDPMASDADRQCAIAVSYALEDNRDSYRNFCLGLVSSLLLNGDNSPLYTALIESGLAQDWADHLCGFDSSTRTATFHIGLQGVRQDDLSAVETAVHDVLSEVASVGFPSQRVESLLHQTEMGIRHDNANFGLRMMMALSSGVNHDSELADLLKTLEYVNRIKQDLSRDPNLLQSLVETHLIDNSHRLTIRMSPKTTYKQESEDLEKDLVMKLNSQLDKETRLSLKQKCEHLANAQQAIEDLDCLPCLQMSDIGPNVDTYPFKMHKNLQLNVHNTNGIVYLRMFFDVKGVDEELLPFIPLFSSVVTSMSTERLHYRELDQAAESCSGGLRSAVHLSGHIRDSSQHEDACAGLLMSSHCLTTNTGTMLELWSELLRDVHFKDAARLCTLVRMLTAGSWSANAVSGQAHRFAMGRAAAALSPLNALSEFWFGLEQARLMKTLSSYSEDQMLEIVAPKLLRLKQLLFNRQRLRMSVNLANENQDSTQALLDVFQSDIPSAAYESKLSLPSFQYPKKTHIELPYSVNYIATAISSVPYEHPDYAKSRVLSKLLSSKYLLREVREIGGAYGVGALVRPGSFTFFSYRDPHSSKTLAIFEKSLQWAMDEKLDQQLLNEAKLSVFQETDKPVSAGSRGQLFFLDKISDNMRQQQRDRLFAVSLTDVVTMAASLRAAIGPASSASVLIGPSADLGADWTKMHFSD